MTTNITKHLGAAQSHFTRLRAGDVGRPHSEITTLEKPAGKAGNRHGCDLGVRLTN
jgi:hypothetical protein